MAGYMTGWRDPGLDALSVCATFSAAWKIGGVVADLNVRHTGHPLLLVAPIIFLEMMGVPFISLPDRKTSRCPCHHRRRQLRRQRDAVLGDLARTVQA